MYTLKIRSKNHTANELRRVIRSNKRAVLRLGSSTPLADIFPGVRDLSNVMEINSVQACKVSGNKTLMKQAFDRAEVKTAEWGEVTTEWDKFPAIIKHNHSSKGNGIYYITNAEELREWLSTHSAANHIIEKYYTYSKEYRLHVTKDGCFYTCRKMLRNDAQERWHRHDSNSVWIVEENPQFAKPANWDDIVAECVKALNAVGLDIAAVDIKVQSREATPKFIILETNSAPSLGERTVREYKTKLAAMLNE